MNSLKNRTCKHRQSGAALVVGLTLLMVITLLAISGMSTSTLELQMAGNMQYSRKALLASDYALVDALTMANYDSTTGLVVKKTTMSAAPGEADWFESTTKFDDSDAGITSVPNDGYSKKNPNTVGFGAYHFVMEAKGGSARNSAVEVESGFYIVGPNCN